jgi:hypothetical protein
LVYASIVVACRPRDIGGNTGQFAAKYGFGRCNREARSCTMVRLEQRGEMWLRPGAPPRQFGAVQLLEVERVAFSWRARFPLAGPLALHVVDSYADGAGELAVRLLGVPLQRERGPETTAGEALRYLAELPLVPPAREHNHELEWRELGGRSVEVATQVGGERLAVTLDLDADGDVVAASGLRGRKVDGEWRATPWGGRFRDYAELGGLRLPTRAEAYWELPEGPYVYWRAEIVGASLFATA